MILVGGYSDSVLLSAIRKEMNLVGMKRITTLFIPEYTDDFCGTYRDFNSLLRDLNPTYVILPEAKSNPRKAMQFESCLKDFQKDNHFLVSKKYDTSVRFLISGEKGFLLLYPAEVGGNSIFKALRIGSGGLMKRTLLINPDEQIESLNNNIFINADALINLTPIADTLWSKSTSICSMIKSRLLIKYPLPDSCNGITKLRNLISSLRHSTSRYIKNNDIVLMKEDALKISVYEIDQTTGIIKNRKILTSNRRCEFQ